MSVENNALKFPLIFIIFPERKEIPGKSCEEFEKRKTFNCQSFQNFKSI